MCNYFKTGKYGILFILAQKVSDYLWKVMHIKATANSACSLCEQFTQHQQ